MINETASCMFSTAFYLITYHILKGLEWRHKRSRESDQVLSLSLGEWSSGF